MSKHSKSKTVDERLAEIRERLSDARRLSGLTQTAIAEAMELSNSQYSRLESGGTEMTLRQFLIACEEMNLNPAALLGADEEVAVKDLRARLSATETKLAAIHRVLGKKDVWET
ncbi:helix-turn-helix transcriptional regulator [Hyphomicrobium sp. ghe19]|uniref:helix-turn-helix domain-containing protein n=1 Tax=Hyphomicrobium sp. ghe19 TaxID=2682968 RepID=UPI0030D11C80